MPGEKRKPSEITINEYLWAAQQVESLKALARFLYLSYGSMYPHLQKVGIMPHVRNLIEEKPGKPGPKTVPSLTAIEGAGPETPPDIEAIKEAARKRYEAKASRAAAKENQHIRFGGDSAGPVALFFVGDQHIGNSGTDVSRVFREQDIILETPGSYVWQLGDSVDNFIIGKLMVENMKPSLPIWEQWELARHYLSRFEGKLVAACSGNHEAWTIKMVGLDYSRDITPSGILYDADEIRATVHVGGHEFKIWSRHKWRGNSIYSQTHGQERAARFDSADFDIYVGAHTHTGAVAREFILNERRKLAIQIGSYKRVDDYARVVGFPANDASTSVGLVLHPDGSYFAASDLKAVQKYMKALYGGSEAPPAA